MIKKKTIVPIHRKLRDLIRASKWVNYHPKLCQYKKKTLGLPKIASLLFITTLDTQLHTAKQYLR